MKTNLLCIAILILTAPLSFSQNSLLQGAVTAPLPSNTIITDIELVSNGTDVVLVACNEANSEFYAIDVADNNPANASTNIVTQIDNFQALIDGATGQSNLSVINFEVNPISKSIYVLASNNTSSFILKIENNGINISVLDQSNMTYSLIDWNGTNGYGSEDMTWGNNTLYITSGSWTLDGEIATIPAPFIHNSTTTNRATSMFKTNWGGGYHTTAPLERMTFANINGEDRLMGVTVCAPGFSFKTSDINGTGVLEVEEQFNITFDPPKKIVHQNQNGINYLFDLHQSWPTVSLLRVGEEFINGSPITNNEFNTNVIDLRDNGGNVTTGLSDEQIKIYAPVFDQIAFWSNCKLLVLENDIMKLFETSTTGECTTSLGTNIIEKTIQAKVVPNPAVDYTQVVIDTDEFSIQASEAIIHSLKGEIILRQQLTSSNTAIDISSLAKGVYSISIIVDGKREHIEKIVIQ